jgi:hypothetical protein
MKKCFFLTQLILTLSLLLTACNIFYPTAKEPPIGENEQWKVEILGIEEFTEPREFVCSDCDLTSDHSRLNLQDKKTYIKVQLHIINKTTEPLRAPDVNIGILLSSSVYGCGGVTVAGADYCLPSGMIRNGEKYVNYGINTPEFKDTLIFDPNPEGETIELLFIVKENAKYKLFYFDKLQPIDIKKIKAVEVE